MLDDRNIIENALFLDSKGEDGQIWLCARLTLEELEKEYESYTGLYGRQKYIMETIELKKKLGGK